MLGFVSITPVVRSRHLAPLTGSSTFRCAPSSLARSRARSVSLFAMTQKRALVAIGEGSEEIESVTVADVLVRAGADVTVASVGGPQEVLMSRGVKLCADVRYDDLPADTVYDVVVLPGGLDGSERLRDCAPLIARVKAALDSPDGPLVASICAAPAVVLGSKGLLGGRRATCYPADAFMAMVDRYVDEEVVVSEDGKLVTSKGPGTAMPFSLKVVECLYGNETAKKLAGEMHFAHF